MNDREATYINRCQYFVQIFLVFPCLQKFLRLDCQWTVNIDVFHGELVSRSCSIVRWINPSFTYIRSQLIERWIHDEGAGKFISRAKANRWAAENTSFVLITLKTLRSSLSRQVCMCTPYTHALLILGLSLSILLPRGGLHLQWCCATAVSS